MGGWTGSPKTTLLIVHPTEGQSKANGGDEWVCGSLDRPGPEPPEIAESPRHERSATEAVQPKPSRQTINRSESHLPLHDSQHSLLHEQTPTPFQHVPHIPRRPFPFSRPRSCSKVCSISHGPPPETSCRSKSRWRDDASSVRFPVFPLCFYLTFLPAWRYAINLNPTLSLLHLSSQVSRKTR